MTGGTESYEDRGIIPRALAMIYDSVGNHNNNNANEHASISLSYLQIYNDKGQDLLNHGKDAKTLDELPNVTIFEGDDEVILKNLDSHHAPTLTDALNLLFLGDTNRLYCETPMNKTSSRSHCVLTVHVEIRNTAQNSIRTSKLNFVDLAGSERVSRTQVNGQILTEAKYINLSLHHLETVIIALSEQAKKKRSHIPFRNSFLTMVLKDSLGENCITSMLATAHLQVSVVLETLSTCRFAQRVSMIKQNAHVNEELDPLLMVRQLKAEVTQLKDRLLFYEKDGKGAERELSEDEKQICAEKMKKFIASREPNAKVRGIGRRFGSYLLLF
ncbi:hypothetical protein AGDE_15222 [Angomonas deanei]|uniref:Kinesin-like protein n=1 Tax=Angomonas deanei TaxID=59799 RepID=A0A7G2CSC7_9TRYP|nr:hypothetical protein AGDE_15222 [Angomonas deanei]CAD2222455.1 Kinesin motor domain containing protein, putative [Angomonas deanei]|eukprot:EPY19467.1 hypothetical protein AGDE_15222 [Angomonas deanei]